MARQRKLSPERKSFINSLLEHYQTNDTNDVQEMLKDLLGDILQDMLEAEINRDIPRDRKGEFEPLIVRKNQTVKKAVYVAIGIRLNECKEVLGM